MSESRVGVGEQDGRTNDNEAIYPYPDIWSIKLYTSHYVTNTQKPKNFKDHLTLTWHMPQEKLIKNTLETFQ